MACATCLQKSIPTPPVSSRRGRSVPVSSPPENNDGCEYTVEKLTYYRDKLVWFKDRALFIKHGYEAKTINKYLGIVLTSLNSNDHCYYSTILDKVESVITLIVELQENV